MSNFIIVPFCMQFSSVYYLMLIAIYQLLTQSENNYKSVSSLITFFTIGMLTNFFDFLTAPLLTLGLPLCVLMIKRLSNELTENETLYALRNSFAWGIGYSITWVSKWILSLLLLGPETLKTVLAESRHRIVGNEDEILDRSQMLMMNIRNFVPPIYRYDDKRYMQIVLIIIFLIFISLVLCMVFWGNFKIYIKRLFPFILVALYPYIWFNIFANHSHIHNFYTYRIQMISVFALLGSYVYYIDLPSKR